MTIKMILEASVPPTDYGYWIKPLGEIVPIGNHGHEAYMKGIGSSSSSAMKQGWIRVTVRSGFQAEACFTQVLPMAKQKLFLLAHQSQAQSYFVDNHSYEGGYTSKFFSTLIDFQRGVENMMQGEMITESILMTEPSTRGYSKFHEDCYDELDRLVSEYRNSHGKPRKWRVVPANLIKMVWRDSAKLGFVRSSKAISTIAKLFYGNIVALQVNNEIAEHDTMSKEEVLADYDFENEEDMVEFIDWAIECETGWRISDYGIRHLIKYAAMLADEPNDDDKLQICDAILNVVHPRSDLASWFVEGGSWTMSEISNQDLTEGDDELPSAISSLTQFLSDPRPIEDLYQTGDVLTYKGDLGEVTAHNERSVSLRMKDGSVRIVSRYDPDLEVAHHSLWRTMTESAEKIYGYWISPMGEAHEVGYEQHDEAIYEIENCSYGDAIHTGWIRVVAPSSPSKKWHIEASRSITREAISALRAITDDRGAYIDAHIPEIADPDDMMLSFMTSTSAQTFLLLNALRRGIITSPEFSRLKI